MADFKEIFDHALARVPDATKIRVKIDGVSVEVERGGVMPVVSAPAPAAAAPLPVSAPAPAPVAASSNVTGNNIIKAPLVGLFYASPSPDAGPFVKVGQTVKKGDVICIIEAMKTMNEILSDYDGEVAIALAENGDMVEYGQPLFEIRP
jgi:acetyl-CoA carboxylase biotin carboxyl carrier protein